MIQTSTSSQSSVEPVTSHKGSFNYLASTVEHSLYRNGKVLTRRDVNGSDAGWDGVVLEARETPVHDARALGPLAPRALGANGFELQNRPLEDPRLVFFSHEQVVRRYYEECARIVREASGAVFTAAFDHNVRSAGGKRSLRRIEGGQQVQGPAHIVHGDYTLTSAPQRLRDLAREPTRNDTLRKVLAPGKALLDAERVDRILDGGRFAIINVWRNIGGEPVATHPLALCDGQTVLPEELVVFEIHYHDRVGENYFAKHSRKHQWYFYPAMTRDEVLLIKQWDSDGELARSGGKRPDSSAPGAPCTFSFHSAFEDPETAPDAPDRWSIEVRCIALYD